MRIHSVLLPHGIGALVLNWGKEDATSCGIEPSAVAARAQLRVPGRGARRPVAPRLTLPVSAINDVARQDPAAVIRLTQAAERVKAAQLGGRSVDLPSATESYRAELSQMEDRAVARLEAMGRRVTTMLRARIRRTLAAAAADPRDRIALRQGRLASELTPTGFDVFGPTTRALRLVPGARPSSLAHATVASPPRSADPLRRRTHEQLRLRTVLATARANLRRLETRERALENAAARGAQAAAAARQRAEAARQAAEDAKAAVRQARAELATAEEALRASETPA